MEKEEHWLLRLVKSDGIKALFWLAMLVFSLCILEMALPSLWDRGALSSGAYRFLRLLTLGLLVASAVMAQLRVGKYLAAHFKRAAAIVMTAAGGFLTAMEIRSFVQHSSPILLLVGLCLMGVGLLLLFSELSKARKARSLERSGLRLEAEITLARGDPVYVNGRQRYTVAARNGEQVFQGSTYVCMEGARGGTLPVLVNPEDPGEYRMLFEETAFPENVIPLPTDDAGERGWENGTDGALTAAEDKPGSDPEPLNGSAEAKDPPEKQEMGPFNWFAIVMSVLFLLVGLVVGVFGVYALLESQGYRGNIIMGAMCLLSGLICVLIGGTQFPKLLRSREREENEPREKP